MAESGTKFVTDVKEMPGIIFGLFGESEELLYENDSSVRNFAASGVCNYFVTDPNHVMQTEQISFPSNVMILGCLNLGGTTASFSIKDYGELIEKNSRWYCNTDDLEPVKVANDLKDYVVENAIQAGIDHDQVSSVLSLIRRHFSMLINMRVVNGSDPEIEEDYLEIILYVVGDIDTFFEEYDRFLDDFVNVIQWPERDKIRVTYNFIDE